MGIVTTKLGQIQGVEHNVKASEDCLAPYLYYFAHALPGNEEGAFHSAELWYMFGTLHRSW